MPGDDYSGFEGGGFDPGGSDDTTRSADDNRDNDDRRDLPYQDAPKDFNPFSVPGFLTDEELGFLEGRSYEPPNPTLQRITRTLGGWLGGFTGAVVGGGVWSPFTGKAGAVAGQYAGSQIGAGGWYSTDSMVNPYEGDGGFMRLDRTDRQPVTLADPLDAEAAPQSFSPDGQDSDNLASVVALGMVGAVALAIVT